MFFKILLSFFTANVALAKGPSAVIPLQDNWAIQDSKQVKAKPEKVSSVGFATNGWIPARVPSTVMANLLPRESDPFFGTNFLNLPGTGPYYPVGGNYGDVVTPPKSIFGRPWWYRTEFTISKEHANRHLDLQFGGITYGAEIWLNGKKISGKETFEGTYRTPSLDVTGHILPGKNALAVLVGVPRPEDLTATWVDWVPTPQDKNMGLWREVVLKTHGDVDLSHLMATTQLDLPSITVAHVTIEAELSNASNMIAAGQLRGRIGDLEFHQDYQLSPHETRVVQFKPADFPQLNIENPRLWWPAQMGSPELYHLTMSVTTGSQLSDETELTFGLRQIDSELTTEGSRLFRVNGRPIQIRGGGWSSDLFLRFSKERMEKELRYVRDLGLNTVRLEGRFEPDEFLSLTDRYGILVMPGWVCCNAWQAGDKWAEKNFGIAAASIRDQIYQFRAHPSVFVFLYGSDEAPPPKVEEIYFNAFRDYHWPNPVLSSAADTTTSQNGRSGVKMNGPYEYTPPSYWYLDHAHGGAWGFNTETSPGPSVPPLESLKQFIPADHLWPIDSVWNFHAGEKNFTNIDIFKNALDARYGPSNSIEEFALKSQVMGYDNHRAMFEAFSRNKYHSATGIVQWMLNNAWPSLIWHLYDYYLRPGGSYYGVKKANEPLHLQYSYDDHTIMLINQTPQDANGLIAETEVFDMHMTSLYKNSSAVSVKADDHTIVTTIPAVQPTSNTYFVKLVLRTDESQQIVSQNFYWLSTQDEVYDWAKTDWKMTPVTREADLKDLNSLPTVNLDIHSDIDWASKKGFVEVTNLGPSLAFFVHFKLTQGSLQKEILPVLWQDNEISLTVGETRRIEVEFPDATLNRDAIEIHTEGWNILPQ